LVLSRPCLDGPQKHPKLGNQILHPIVYKSRPLRLQISLLSSSEMSASDSESDDPGRYSDSLGTPSPRVPFPLIFTEDEGTTSVVAGGVFETAETPDEPEIVVCNTGEEYNVGIAFRTVMGDETRSGGDKGGGVSGMARVGPRRRSGRTVGGG